MNTVPTYRRGRQVYHPGERRTNCCDKFVHILVCFLLITIPPIAFFSSEFNRYNAYTSLSEVINRNDIIELGPWNSDSTEKLKPGHVVHGSPTKILASTHDPDMGIIVPNSFSLSRNTEYCQWEEIRRESCETCTRTKRDSETGESKTENYDCNCVTTFDYIKSWRSYRINSFLFDQPAAHHNPQRDPLPSSKFVSQDAQLSFQPQHDNSSIKSSSPSEIRAHLAPSMLQNGIRGAKSLTIKWVRGGIPPTTSSWFRWIPDRTQYENLNDLDNHAKSYAANQENFVYVGEGYFFSPYQASRYNNMFKYFMQYLEGSLFDWQIGDLMPSCQAGDIRIRYTVQKPSDISIIGEISRSDGRHFEIQPIKTSNGQNVGLVHNGIHSFQDMIIAADHDSIKWAIIFRVVFCLWTVGITRFLGRNFFDVDISQAKAPTQIAVALSLWFAALGLIWNTLWGVQVDGIISIVASFVLALFVYWYPPQKEVNKKKIG